MWSRLRHAPAIVVLTKSNGGFVLEIDGIERRTDFVERVPFPHKFDVGPTSLLTDTADSEQFSPGDGKREYRLAGLLRWDKRADGFDAERSQQNIPARRRSEAGGARRGIRHDPTVALQ